MALMNNQKIIENWILQDSKKPVFDNRTIQVSKKNQEIVSKQDLENQFYNFLLELGK
jgi:hypothetical protein